MPAGFVLPHDYRFQYEKDLTAAIDRVLIQARQSDSLAVRDVSKEVTQATKETIALVYLLARRSLVDRMSAADGLGLDAIAGDESVQLEHAQQWARRTADELGRGFAKVSRQMLASGTAPADVWAASRAESIGITQVTDAISHGEQAAAEVVQQKTGVILKSIWETAEDDKVCPVCRPLHGAKQEVWQTRFPVGPPAHPRCRCALRWVP